MVYNRQKTKELVCPTSLTTDLTTYMGNQKTRSRGDRAADGKMACDISYDGRAREFFFPPPRDVRSHNVASISQHDGNGTGHLIAAIQICLFRDDAACSFLPRDATL